jgi:hypothetical protein
VILAKVVFWVQKRGEGTKNDFSAKHKIVLRFFFCLKLLFFKFGMGKDSPSQ